MRELETSRLDLRYIRESDTQRIYECWASDKDVAKFLTWNAHESIEQTKEYMSYILKEYNKQDCYRWGIALKSTTAPFLEESTSSEMQHVRPPPPKSLTPETSIFSMISSDASRTRFLVKGSAT